jgi:hypothetical protein
MDVGKGRITALFEIYHYQVCDFSSKYKEIQEVRLLSMK